MYRGRFAPSPTGPLHFGSLVAAVASFLDARANEGSWLVRIEDVDTTRTVPGAESELLRALEALCLHWDGPVVRQSERTERYREALERLQSAARIYRCRCSRKEIADSALIGIGGPVYPGKCRDLQLPRDTAGADRIRVATELVRFEDRVMGRVEQDIGSAVGDFILKRRDNLFAYQLAVVVDDAEQEITHVVRGADLLLSTPRQIVLQRALGYSTPAYLHFPVAADTQGRKLSKQTHAAAIDLRHPGEALAEALDFLGQPVPGSRAPGALLAAATAAWNPSKIPRSTSIPVTVRDASEQPRGV